MQGKWQDIMVSRFYTGIEKNINARAHYKADVCPSYEDAQTGRMGLLSMADFVYVPDDNRVIKNRFGNIEDLHNMSMAYMTLKHHPNEQVRKLFGKALMLAALTED